MKTKMLKNLSFDICASIYYIRCQARQCPIFNRIYNTLHKHYGYSDIHTEDVLAQLNANIKEGLITVYERDNRNCYKLDLTKFNLQVLEGAAFKKEFKRTKLNRQKLMLKTIREIFLRDGTKKTLLTISNLRLDIQQRDASVGMELEELNDYLTFCLRKAENRGAIKIYGDNINLIDEAKFLKKSGSNNGFIKSRLKKSEKEENSLTNRALVASQPAARIMLCSICVDPNNDEELLFCHDCGRSGHPSCLLFTEELTSRVRSLKWQCIECKRCSICVEAGNEDMMLFCDNCDRGFHMTCCDPQILEPPQGEWICCICSTNITKKSVKKSSKPDFEDKKISEIPEQIDYLDGLDDCDVKLYSKIQQTLYHKSNNNESNSKKLHPASVVIGKHRIFSWYSSPFPDYLKKTDTIFFCEFCLQCFESLYPLQHHMNSYCHLCPPGDEIYRDDVNKISVFEVAGHKSFVYCRNLCLLAKLFIDHKTVYHDVDLFLFYILTINEGGVNKIVGFFSKEKYCHQNYNLSCIATFPQYQRCGYGYFLIAFSYLLSRKAEIPGSPEKPLSYLGKISYESYWKSAIVDYLSSHQNQFISLNDISFGTGMSNEDISNTLLLLNLFNLYEDNLIKVVFCEDFFEKEVKFRAKKIYLDESKLIWMPFSPNSSLDSTSFNSEIANVSRKNETLQSVLISPDVSHIRSPRKKLFRQCSFINDEELVVCSTPVTKQTKNKKIKNDHNKLRKRRALFTKKNLNKSCNIENTSLNELDSHNHTRFNLRPKRNLSSLSYDDKSLLSPDKVSRNKTILLKKPRFKNIRKLNKDHKENLSINLLENYKLNRYLRSSSSFFNDSKIAKNLETGKSFKYFTDITLSNKKSINCVAGLNKAYNTRCSNSLKKYDQYDGINHRKSLVLSDDKSILSDKFINKSQPEIKLMHGGNNPSGKIMPQIKIDKVASTGLMDVTDLYLFDQSENIDQSKTNQGKKSLKRKGGKLNRSRRRKKSRKNSSNMREKFLQDDDDDQKRLARLTDPQIPDEHKKPSSGSIETQIKTNLKEENSEESLGKSQRDTTGNIFDNNDKKEKSTDCDSALIPLLCVHG